jgi:hypothetical protein
MALPWQEDRQQFRESGSYRFTKEQRESYFLYLDIRIVSFVHQKYVNFKTLPEYGFWGYSTVFYGAVPDRKIQQEFVAQRVIREVNRDTLTMATVVSSHLSTLTSIKSLGTALNALLVEVPFQSPTAVGMPETVVKFKGLPLSQFEFACYWLPYEPFAQDALLFETDDPTDGDDEYPQPNENDPSNPYAGNPPASDPNPDSDPRDFSPENVPEGFPQDVYFGLTVVAWDGNPSENCTGNLTFFENVVWPLAGPPPYTTQNAGLPSPCTNAGNGYIIVAGDGSTSPIFNGGGTTYSASINVFQLAPFDPPP